MWHARWLTKKESQSLLNKNDKKTRKQIKETITLYRAANNIKYLEVTHERSVRIDP